MGEGRDDWLGVDPLFLLLPRLFRIVSSKEFVVKDCCVGEERVCCYGKCPFLLFCINQRSRVGVFIEFDSLHFQVQSFRGVFVEIFLLQVD